jgi:ABC-type anion transport system duplicated permease subunit
MDMADKTIPLDELWSVLEFSRRYRLDKEEEARLIRIFGPFASPRVLLSNARRYSLAG